MEQNNLNNNTNIETPVDNNGFENKNLGMRIFKSLYISFGVCTILHGFAYLYDILPNWWNWAVSLFMLGVPFAAFIFWLNQIGILEFANPGYISSSDSFSSNNSCCGSPSSSWDSSIHETNCNNVGGLGLSLRTLND